MESTEDAQISSAVSVFGAADQMISLEKLKKNVATASIVLEWVVVAAASVESAVLLLGLGNGQN